MAISLRRPLAHTPAAGRHGLEPAAAPARESLPSAGRASPRVHETPVAIFDNYWGATLSFVASLGRRGVPLHVYGSGAARWSRFASRRFACPPVEDAERFLPWLEQRVRSGEIHRVAPTTDLIAYYTSLLRSAFAPEVQRAIAPLAEVETCLVKTRFAAACSLAGQATPPSLTPEDLETALLGAERIGYPLILKPKSHLAVGAAERGRIVYSAEQLRAYFRPYPIVKGQESLASRYPELRWPLLQRYVPTARSQVFSVSGFKDPDGGILAASLSVKRSQWPQDTGPSTSQVSWRDERILNAGRTTVDKMISRGIFELELLTSDSDLLAIDLNPRAFGFLSLDMALGHDLPWLWFQSTLAPVVREPSPPNPIVIEARLGLPYWMGRAARWLLGLARQRDTSTGERALKVDKRISMLGHWADPIPLMLRAIWLMRHPRSLIRGHFRDALRSGHPRAGRVS